MLYKIQDIAIRRKDIAEREFLKQKSIVAECKKEVEKRKKTLEEYIASIPRLEDETFAKIFNKAVADRDLDVYKAEIRKIHDHTDFLRDELKKAEEELAKQEEILEEKRKVLMAAIKKVEKFKSLIETKEEEENFLATLAEDNEIEEAFRPKSDE